VKSLPAMVPAVIPMLLLMLPAMLTALAVVREKELGSIINFYVTPTTRSEFLLGKQLPYVVLALLNYGLMCLAAVTVFGVPMTGSFATLTLAAVLFCLCSTGMGLLASTVTRSQIAAMFFTMVGTMIPAVQFSGLINPVSSLEGGGRIIGEVCHFLDFMQFITGAVPVSVYASAIAGGVTDAVNDDSVFITVQFRDGSNGMIAYLAEGDRGLAKEHVEIFAEGKTFVIEDFRSTRLYANGREKKEPQRKQDKGQAEETRVACAVVASGKPAPITLESLEATTRATFRIRDSLRTGSPMKVMSD